MLEERVERLLVGEAYSTTIPDADIRLAFKGAITVLNERTITSIDNSLAKSPPAAKREELLQHKARLEDLAFSLETQQAADRREIKATSVTPAVDTAPGDSVVEWSNYDFDIFWCDGTPNAARAKELADEIVKLKVRDQAAEGQWRVRPLPHLTNMRPGYRVSGFEIRVSSDDEKPFGHLLAQEATKLLQARDVQDRFVVRHTQRQTRWYLSVFVCPS